PTPPPPPSPTPRPPAPTAAPAIVAPVPSPTTVPTTVPTIAPAPATASSVPAWPSAAPAPPAAPSPAGAASGYPLTVTDDAGRTVKIARRPVRLVSLVPSCTEILYAVGAGDRVVGVDDFSDFPAEAKTKAKVGGMKTNLEKVLALTPDLVCATRANPADTLRSIEQANIAVLILDAKDVDGIAADIVLVGKAVDAQPQAERVVANLRERIETVKAKVAGAPKVRIYHELDASDPAKPFTIGPGSFVDALITIAGGQNVFAAAKSQYPQASLEELIRADPEVITLADAAFGITPDSVAKRTGWATITAIKKKAIYPIDQDVVSRPGPRIAEGIEAFARILHPERFR
ncbi:MAG: cobalamin-binding protein, partial [Chloroflexi bacterium]|nr:cobalamin-binding protein [Chloroflexota bacterium]